MAKHRSIQKDALQNLDNQQLESVARGFNDGTSKRDLENILEDVRLDQFEHIMESVQVRRHEKTHGYTQLHAILNILAWAAWYGWIILRVMQHFSYYPSRYKGLINKSEGAVGALTRGIFPPARPGRLSSDID